MKTRAVSMVLLMIASALAGCTSGDPDGDGEMGIDTDLLNQMIEDNLQDFINNSSVTVHQTIHYHNNTTYVDNSESNMNVGGSGANGSGSSGEVLFVMHMELTAADLAPDLVPRSDNDPRNLIYSYNKTFEGYIWVDTSNGSNSSGYYEQTLISIIHQVPCSIFYTFENGGGENYSIYGENFWQREWAYENYFRDVYGYDNSHSTSAMTGYDYYYAGQQSEDFCNPVWTPWVAENLIVNIGNITIPQGYMISLSVPDYYHVWGNTTMPLANGTQYNSEGGSISGLSYVSEHTDYMLFSRESGGISGNQISDYGGWDDLEVEMYLHFERFWENTNISFTILYSFTPVIPVE